MCRSVHTLLYSLKVIQSEHHVFTLRIKKQKNTGSKKKIFLPYISLNSYKYAYGFFSNYILEFCCIHLGLVLFIPCYFVRFSRVLLCSSSSSMFVDK